MKEKRTDRSQIKVKAVMLAASAFQRHGIKNVRMDDVASALGISKRTLYELFADKEDLLLEVMKVRREEMRRYMEDAATRAENVLELIIMFYERMSDDFRKTNCCFLDEIKKYPRAMSFLDNNHRENASFALKFYEKGVEQGLFLKDINYPIIQESLRSQLDILVPTSYGFSLSEIFKTIIFIHLRGISTDAGRKILDKYLVK